MRDSNDDVGAAFVLRYLGVLASARGNPSAAPGFLEESLAIARRVGAAMDAAMALAFLGDLALHHDDVERARGLFEESALILRQVGSQLVLVYPLRRLGLLAYLRGEIQVAIQLCVESIGRNHDGAERLSVAAGLVTLAAIADSQGEPELAVQLLSKADALASSIGGQMLPFEAEQYEAAVAHTRERLAPDAWRQAWADGRTLSLDDALRRMEQLADRANPAPAQPGRPSPPRDHARSM
jgi:tetratricopeptide (TPR) repeat protein